MNNNYPNIYDLGTNIYDEVIDYNFFNTSVKEGFKGGFKVGFKGGLKAPTKTKTLEELNEELNKLNKQIEQLKETKNSLKQDSHKDQKQYIKSELPKCKGSKHTNTYKRCAKSVKNHFTWLNYAGTVNRKAKELEKEEGKLKIKIDEIKIKIDEITAAKAAEAEAKAKALRIPNLEIRAEKMDERLIRLETQQELEEEEKIQEKKRRRRIQLAKHQKKLNNLKEGIQNAQEDWDSYKTAFCPAQGTYSMDMLNFNQNFEVFDTNRYTNIETETKNTYDLLKRSEICTAVNNEELTANYKNKVDTEQEIIKREHSDLLRYYEKFMGDIQAMLNESAEENTNTNTTLNYTGKNVDDINKRKSYYQSVQSQERKWYIRLIEIIYIIVWFIMAVSVFLKPGLSILNKVVTISLFLIVPYFTYNYLIEWIQIIKNYILTTFNVYDSVYNNVK